MLQIQYIYSDHHLSTLNITAEVNLVWQLGDVDLEPVLDLVENLGVALVTDEGDGQTLGTKPAGSGHSVQVCVCVLWHVVVEHNVHSFNIHSYRIIDIKNEAFLVLSQPLPNRFVATKIRFWKSLNCWYLDNLSS